VGGRLAGDGYTPDLVTDIRSALTELGKRASGAKLGIVGFCFGGGMVWQTLNSGPTDLAAAVPLYGPAPDSPTFTGTKAAVLGIFAEKDARVNAGKDKLDKALGAAGTTHEFVVVPGVDHAFFNDTGPRYNEPAAAATYRRVLDWFGAHLA
jgi:carboxymethylenebutenolidase